MPDGQHSGGVPGKEDCSGGKASQFHLISFLSVASPPSPAVPGISELGAAWLSFSRG